MVQAGLRPCGQDPARKHREPRAGCPAAPCGPSQPGDPQNSAHLRRGLDKRCPGRVWVPGTSSFLIQIQPQSQAGPQGCQKGHGTAEGHQVCRPAEATVGPEAWHAREGEARQGASEGTRGQWRGHRASERPQGFKPEDSEVPPAALQSSEPGEQGTPMCWSGGRP